jgi:hypothetical protein
MTMAKNLGRTYATMSEDERRRFAREQLAAGDVPEQLEFGDPRDEDPSGVQDAEPKKEEGGGDPGPEAA